MDKPNFREMIMHWSSLNPAFKIDNIDYAKCDLQFVEKLIQFKRRMADDCSVSSFYINSSEHDKISLIIHMFSVLSISKVTEYETPQLREEAKKMVDVFFADAKDELKMVFRSHNKEQSVQTES